MSLLAKGLRWHQPRSFPCPVLGSGSCFHSDSAFEDGSKCITTRLVIPQVCLSSEVTQNRSGKAPLSCKEDGGTGSREMKSNLSHCPVQSKAFTEIWGHPTALSACMPGLEGSRARAPSQQGTSPFSGPDGQSGLMLMAGGACWQAGCCEPNRQLGTQRGPHSSPATQLPLPTLPQRCRCSSPYTISFPQGQAHTLPC